MIKINITKITNFSGHRAAVYTLQKSIHTNCLYSSGADGLIVEWDTEKKDDGKLIATIGKPVYSLQLDEASLQLICGTSTGNLQVIDLKENKEVRNIEAHQLGIFDMKLSSENLITCGGDGTVNIFDRTNLSLLKKINHSEKSARVIAVNPTKKEIAVGYSDFIIRLYDTENFELTHTLEAHTNSVFALCFSPDGKYLISGGRDAMLNVWDIKNNYQLILEIPAHILQIKCIAYNPSGNLFATSSMDKTIKIWDADNFELIKVIDKARNESHTNCINKILWLNDDEFLSCSDDRQVMLWDVDFQ
ncbi:MAG: WD40 repeat domain-containing protein [Bacteroidota bacterium]